MLGLEFTRASITVAIEWWESGPCLPTVFAVVRLPRYVRLAEGNGVRGVCRIFMQDAGSYVPGYLFPELLLPDEIDDIDPSHQLRQIWGLHGIETWDNTVEGHQDLLEDLPLIPGRIGDVQALGGHDLQSVDLGD